jgi:chromate reductase, NAD(P)H dehydrogenase (quinone)
MTHRPTTQRPTANQILAISGSLRRDSYNTAALLVAAELSKPRAVVSVDDSIRRLPQFNPDLDDSPPEGVRPFRTACTAATALLAELIVPLQDESRHGG